VAGTFYLPTHRYIENEPSMTLTTNLMKHIRMGSRHENEVE
jgi:hypothetical protein